jgi:hypothetical protein
MDSNPNISQFDKSFSRQLDTSAFSVPDNFVKGRSATGVIRGPGQMNVDLSAAKKFVVHDFLHANIGDFFNAFNHSQWTGVCSTSPSCFDNDGNEVPFGQVISWKEGRILQLGIKLMF